MIPLYLLDPPDTLARPIDDADYIEDLKDSLRRMGQIDPIIVRPRGVRYQIIDGMHRFAAARDLGWQALLAQVYTSEHLPVEAIQLHANQVHREMTPWEEHLFYARLCNEFSLSFEEVCTFTRRSEKYVSDRLLLGNLTEESKAALQSNQISFGVARELLRLKDPAWERYYLDLCLRTGTGTQVLHTWVTQQLQKQQQPTPAQIEQAQQPVINPPPPIVLMCAFCGGAPEGRGMTQVWVHADELATIVHTIRATFQRAAAAGGNGEPGTQSQQ
jgi:ParB family chromosome partitioning protein